MQGGLKHVQKRNKHAKKNCAPSWLYLKYILFNLISFLKYNKQHRLWFSSFGGFLQLMIHPVP